MTLEWIRRRSPKFDKNLRTYLFTEGPITEVEEAIKEGGGGGPPRKGANEKPEKDSAAASGPPKDSSLGVGSLDTTTKVR
jgi:hypothetical protein